MCLIFIISTRHFAATLVIIINGASTESFLFNLAVARHPSHLFTTARSSPLSLCCIRQMAPSYGHWLPSFPSSRGQIFFPSFALPSRRCLRTVSSLLLESLFVFAIFRPSALPFCSSYTQSSFSIHNRTLDNANDAALHCRYVLAAALFHIFPSDASRLSGLFSLLMQ